MHESQLIRLGQNYSGWLEVLNSKKDLVLKGLKSLRYFFIPIGIGFKLKETLDYILIKLNRDLTYQEKIFFHGRGEMPLSKNELLSEEILDKLENLPQYLDYNRKIEKLNISYLWGEHAYEMDADYLKFSYLILFLCFPTLLQNKFFEYNKSNKYKKNLLKIKLLFSKEKEMSESISEIIFSPAEKKNIMDRMTDLTSDNDTLEQMALQKEELKCDINLLSQELDELDINFSKSNEEMHLKKEALKKDFSSDEEFFRKSSDKDFWLLVRENYKLELLINDKKYYGKIKNKNFMR